MEYYWTLFNNSNGSSTTNTIRGHNGSFAPTHAWDSSWDLPISTAPAPAASRPEWTFYTPLPDFQPLIVLHDQQKTSASAAASATGYSSSSSSSSSSSHYCNPDPHLTCLKLGKRHYFEDLTTPPDAAAGVGPFSITKKGKSCVGTAAAGVPSSPADAVVPLCQVEGCEAVLVNAKDYHRRHKVCQMHAKAPKVVVLGIEQRFCQQCSRFHAVAEFDEAKRSCRRRLAGHNERRRKSSQEHNSIARKHYQEIKMMGTGRHPHLVNYGDCALSLLSPTNSGPWNVSTCPDLPARCSAALRELIAENRQLINATQMENYKLRSSWGATTAPENRGHVTLNLMQGPDSAFGLLSAHDHRSSVDDGDGDCSDLWKLPLGY